MYVLDTDDNEFVNVWNIWNSVFLVFFPKFRLETEQPGPN
jgi:hypothetical protein